MVARPMFRVVGPVLLIVVALVLILADPERVNGMDLLALWLLAGAMAWTWA